jgi:hypothetical protein
MTNFYGTHIIFFRNIWIYTHTPFFGSFFFLSLHTYTFTTINIKSLFRFIENIMYLVNNIDHLHYFFNKLKKNYLW